MLKGVNKQILEVTNTESPYFEKIIFFVRASSPTFDSGKLKREAEKISSSTATKPPRTKISKGKILLGISYLAVSLLSGLAIYFLVHNYLVG